MKRLLIFLALWLASSPAIAAPADRCVPNDGSYPVVVQTYIDNLRADAFADAYATYIADLERVRIDSQQWSSEQRAYAEGRCRTYEDSLDVYEQDVRNWAASVCVLGPMVEAMVGECDYRHSQLEMRRRILDDRASENLAITTDLSRRSDLIEAAGQRAFEHANMVLDPAHVEEALRLYITWLQRTGATDSCHSLGQIAERLGMRVSDPWTYLELLARNLVPSPVLLSGLIRVSDLAPFRFAESGFKPRFRGAPTDNQVRHAVSYMVVGYESGRTGADLVTQLLDERIGQQQDYALGVEAGDLGSQLAIGTYDTGNFGRAVTQRLCE